jgi:outer membrane protein assembly factor BamB
MINKSILTILFTFFAATTFSQVISQWRGPDRNGVYDESGLLDSWPETGPEQILSVKGLGKGHSSPAITDSFIYVTGLKDTMDILSALSHKGEKLWETAYGKGWESSFPDTRSTPTVDGDKIYVISGMGEVVCLDAERGGILWSVDGLTKFEGKYGKWGVAESPLIVDDKVIYTPGGMETTIVALDKKTGETIWQSKTLNDTTAYVSPILITHNNRKIIANVLAKYIVGVDAENGKLLWAYNYSELEKPVWHELAPVINANSPVYRDGNVYVTSGYNHVGAMFKLSNDGSEVELMWNDTTLDCHVGGVVALDNYIYGSNWIDNRNGNWCSINWETGETMYETEWKCKGSIIAAGKNLICYDEKSGFVGLVEPNPKQFNVISSFRITEGSGPHWAHPVVAKGKLYIRHGDVLMVYHISS